MASTPREDSTRQTGLDISRQTKQTRKFICKLNSSLSVASFEEMATVSNKYTLDAKELRPMVQKCTMPREMRDFAIKISSTLIQRQLTDDDVARELRSSFDHTYGKGWNVIVGRDFGEFVTFFKKRYIFFYVGRSAIVIYKSLA